MKTRLVAAFAVGAALLWATAAVAQVPNQGIGVPNTPPGGIAGAATAGDLLAANSAGQAADSSTACATAGCTLPTALNMTGNIVYTSSVSGPANGGGLWWNGASGINVSGTSSDAGTTTYSRFLINSDNVVSTASNGVFDFVWQSNCCGAAATGGRQLGTFTLNINGVPADTNGSYTALASIAQASINDGGLTGVGNGKGHLYGLNPNVRLINGATFWHQLVGQETDIAVGTGASVEQTIGHQVVQTSAHAVAPSVVGIAYSANSATGVPGWNYLYADGGYDGFPSLVSTGSFAGCYPHANSGNCGTIGYGIDFNNYAVITNYVLRGPQANGFIDGNFNIKSNNLPTGNGSIVVNGDMAIDQVHEGGNLAGGGLAIDRWRITSSNGANRTSARAVDAPAGYSYSYLYTNGTGISAPIATATTNIFTQLESTAGQFLGWGAAGAKGVMFDFCAKSSLAGTYAAALANNAKNRSYVVSYTLASPNVWQCFSNAVPGDTTGTWNTITPGSMGIFVQFDLGSGSNFNTTAGAWQAGNFLNTAASLAVTTTTGQTLNFTAVHIYPGVVQTAYVPRPYAEELALAQRFYRKTFPAGTAPVQNGGIAGCVTVKNPIALGDPAQWIAFDPPMETSPTITTYNPSVANANWRDITAAADVTVSVDPGSTKSSTGFQLATSGTVTTLGDILCIHYVADTGN